MLPFRRHRRYFHTLSMVVSCSDTPPLLPRCLLNHYHPLLGLVRHFTHRVRSVIDLYIVPQAWFSIQFAMVPGRVAWCYMGVRCLLFSLRLGTIIHCRAQTALRGHCIYIPPTILCTCLGRGDMLSAGHHRHKPAQQLPTRLATRPSSVHTPSEPR